MNPSRPNILFIITHDTGRQLGCYGRPTSSPGIDDLAHDPLELRPRVATTPNALPPVGQSLHRTLLHWMERTQDPLLAGPVACPVATE